MNPFARPLLLSAALCVATVVPVHAEIDVIKLKAAIETSVEAVPAASPHDSASTLYHPPQLRA